MIGGLITKGLSNGAMIRSISRMVTQGLLAEVVPTDNVYFEVSVDTTPFEVDLLATTELNITVKG